MKITGIFFFLLIISCKEKTYERNESVYHFDVMNDSLKETLIVEKDFEKKSNRNIYILQKDKKIKICSILPMND